MAQIEKGAKRYPSDLTNEEWERIAPLLSTPPPRVDQTPRSSARRSCTRRPTLW